MLSPALLKDSLTRRSSASDEKIGNSRNRHGSTLQTMNEDQEVIEFSKDRRRSSTSSIIVMDQIESSPRRNSTSFSLSANDRKTRRNSNQMFSKSSNLFGTSSIRENYKDEQKARYRRGSILPAIQSGISQNRRDSSYNGNRSVPIHQYTEDPTVAWEMLREKRPVKPVRQMRYDTPVKSDHVRFVCIACTHGEHFDLSTLPQGDILLVAGDFTSCGLPNEIHHFNKLLGRSKFSYKVVIGGNHECTFDDNFLKSNKATDAKEMALKQALLTALNSDSKTGTSSKDLLSNAIYLEDNVIELFGITIYGTPWQPRVDNWAFNLSRGQALLDKWNMIPSGVDVLLTHTPPLGHGDQMLNGQRMGCVELLNTVFKRVRPKYHVFGHIHEGYGCTTDGYTKFINCCLCNENLDMKNDPVIFDIPVHPHTKQFYLQNVKKVMKRFQKKK